VKVTEMAAADRSFSDVLHNIIRNVQEIVRSEVRLAKAEIQEEAVKTKTSILWLGAGVLTGIFGVFFLLFTTVYALAIVLPMWAAALIVGLALSIVAAMTLSAGVRRFKLIHPAPERTLESIKENVEWAKQHNK